MAVSPITDFAIKDHAVRVGTTIRWTNQHQTPHTTTAGTPDRIEEHWDSGRLNPEASSLSHESDDNSDRRGAGSGIATRSTSIPFANISAGSGNAHARATNSNAGPADGDGRPFYAYTLAHCENSSFTYRHTHGYTRSVYGHTGFANVDTAASDAEPYATHGHADSANVDPCASDRDLNT